MKIRPYITADELELMTMIMALYTEDMQGEVMTSEKIQKTIQKLNNEPNRGAIYLIENQEVIIGYSIVIYFWSNEYGGEFINIDELFFKENYRGKGYGKTFFNWLESAYPAAVAFQLETTTENIEAQGFYKKIGFETYPNLVYFKRNK